MLGLLGAIWLTIVIGCVAVCNVSKWEVRGIRADLGRAVHVQLPHRFGVEAIKEVGTFDIPPPVGVAVIIQQLQEQNRLLEKQSKLLEKIIEDGIGAEAAEAEERRARIQALLDRAEQIATGQDASYGPKGKLPG